MISSVYVPFFCIQSYAVKLQIDEGMAFYLLAITNVASLFGRLFPNWLADRYDIRFLLRVILQLYSYMLIERRSQIVSVEWPL